MPLEADVFTLFVLNAVSVAGGFWDVELAVSALGSIFAMLATTPDG
jgi:hypothetical protein